jgi:hypothetical protein
MEDFLKQPIDVGDYVVFVGPIIRESLVGSNLGKIVSTGLGLGKIKSFSDGWVQVSTDWLEPLSVPHLIVKPENLIKVDDTALMVYLLKK